MSKKQKTCLFLFSCFILLFSGIALSEEGKIEKKNDPADNTQTEEITKEQLKLVFPWIDKEYSMKVIKPYPGIDNEIVKNNFDPNIDYKLRIINPYTRKEITGSIGQCFSIPKTKLLSKSKKYGTPLNIPVK